MGSTFRPHDVIAAAIFDAFEDEARHRASRTPDQWMRAEQERVLLCANDLATRHRLSPVTLRDVERAQTLACGHTDYASKWAIGVTERMRRPALRQLGSVQSV